MEIAEYRGNVYVMTTFCELLLTISCFPVITLRDAWITADVYYGHRHNRILWRAFASRGLGVGAASFRDSFVVPDFEHQ